MFIENRNILKCSLDLMKVCNSKVRLENQEIRLSFHEVGFMKVSTRICHRLLKCSLHLLELVHPSSWRQPSDFWRQRFKGQP